MAVGGACRRAGDREEFLADRLFRWDEDGIRHPWTVFNGDDDDDDDDNDNVSEEGKFAEVIAAGLRTVHLS